MRIGDSTYDIVVEGEGVAGDLGDFIRNLTEAGFKVWSPHGLSPEQVPLSFPAFVDKGRVLKGCLASESRTSGWIVENHVKKCYAIIVPYLNRELEEFVERYRPVPVKEAVKVEV